MDTFTPGELAIFAGVATLLLTLLAMTADMMWRGLRRNDDEGQEESLRLSRAWTIARRMDRSYHWPLALALFMIGMVLMTALLIRD